MNAPENPYRGKPDFQFWNSGRGELLGAFDPVVETGFKISKGDKIVTAGSCFAQHLARNLHGFGFNHFVTETAHPSFPEASMPGYHYGDFSARYGNVYTARQLKQLFQRAYGEFQPIETVWRNKHNQVVDPFRPQIQEGGFSSVSELEADVRQHLNAVRMALEGLSVFVFTLGLTEAWEDVRDGAIYPLAPGVAGGVFNREIHNFRNFTVQETVDDLKAAFEFLRSINPEARILITVSPVPLNATAERRHVAVSTCFSKAVLRVAAEVICAETMMCDYFPSYEIITSPQTRSLYYGEDGRTVLNSGVEHVMRVFGKHYCDFDGIESHPTCALNVEDQTREHFLRAEKAIDVLCDEQAISNK